MAKILLDKITKIYKKKGKSSTVAVRDVSLEIPDKMFVGLLGPSGCGKTTTLRIIAGLEKPSSGRVYFDDIDVTEWDAFKRNVAMVFQFPALYPDLTVYENIALSLRVSKISKQDEKEKVKEVADFLAITDYLNFKVSKTDSNLRQKVAIAKVMVRDPSVFILDEPLTIVEPRTRIELRSKLKEIQSKLGKPMIYVSHDQSEVLTLSDKVAVMNNGEILQYDTPELLFNKPRDTFVAWFIGNPGMNFINCDLVEESNRIYLTTDQGFKYDISYLTELHTVSSFKKVILGIRPEHVIISSNGIKAKCLHIEKFGHVNILHLETCGVMMKAKVPKTTYVQAGQELYIDFDKKGVTLFDYESKKAIF